MVIISDLLAIQRRGGWSTDIFECNGRASGSSELFGDHAERENLHTGKNPREKIHGQEPGCVISEQQRFASSCRSSIPADLLSHHEA